MDELQSLREQIDRLDAALVYVLGQRFACTEKIGRIKKDRGLPGYDEQRETSQKERLFHLAADAGLAPGVMEKIFETVTAAVRERHDQIRHEK